MAKPKTIDEYIAGLEGWQREVAQAVRELVRDAGPKEMTEAIKWAQPVFSVGGPLAFMKAAKNHVTLGFWRGAELDDPKGLLEGSGDRMRHVKITGPADVKKAAIRAWVKQAVKLNRELGDPTKRAKS